MPLNLRGNRRSDKIHWQQDLIDLLVLESSKHKVLHNARIFH